MDEMTIQLEPELQRQLCQAALEQGRSEADVIHEALTLYLQGWARPFPRSVGLGEDGEIPASEIKSWLRDQWSKR